MDSIMSNKRGVSSADFLPLNAKLTQRLSEAAGECWLIV